jgi:flagellar motor protein MotB
MPSNRRKVIVKRKFLLILLSMSAAATYSQAMTVDFKNVYFKPGLPNAGGNLESSAVKFKGYAIPALTANASTFLKIKPDFKVKIVGFTDNQECAGDACYALSLRRALLVQAWLIAHGFPPERLLAPEGHGNNEPIDTNASASGRLRNRRAEFQMVRDVDQTVQ